MADMDEEEKAVINKLQFDDRQKKLGLPQSHELVRLCFTCYCYELQNLRYGVQKSLKAPLIFVRKGFWNLKCYVASAKSLVRKRVCRGRYPLNQLI